MEIILLLEPMVCSNYVIKQGIYLIFILIIYIYIRWTYSFEKTECGSIMDVSWSADGTICAGACGNGSLVCGYIVDRALSYENWEVTLNEDNK